MDWNKFANGILVDVENLFTGTLKSYKGAAEKDVKAFLEASRADLEKWSIQLSEGKLTKDEYGTLVKGKTAVLQMIALKQIGLAKIEQEKLVNNLIAIIIKAAFSLIL